MKGDALQIEFAQFDAKDYPVAGLGLDDVSWQAQSKEYLILDAEMRSDYLQRVAKVQQEIREEYTAKLNALVDLDAEERDGAFEDEATADEEAQKKFPGPWAEYYT